MGKLAKTEISRLLFGTEALRRFTQSSPVMPDVWLEFNEPTGPADAAGKKEEQDLLFTPHEASNASMLFKELREQLQATSGLNSKPKRPGSKKPATATTTAGMTPWDLAYNGGYVVARLTFKEMVQTALPLTDWWTKYVWAEARRMNGRLVRQNKGDKRGKLPGGLSPKPSTDPHEALKDRLRKLQTSDMGTKLAKLIQSRRDVAANRPLSPRETRDAATRRTVFDPTNDLLWLIEIVGSMQYAKEHETPPEGRGEPVPPEEVIKTFQQLVKGIVVPELPTRPVLWNVNLNRRGTWAMFTSVATVKADATARLFDVSCKGLRWAVIDSGIDAGHWAFRARREPQPQAAGAKTGPRPDLYKQPFEGSGPRRKNRTRVERVYDFTKIRDHLSGKVTEAEVVGPEPKPLRKASAEQVAEIDFKREVRRVRKEAFGTIERDVSEGAMLDWDRLAVLLEVTDPFADEARPPHFHGTHVAGILAADWRRSDGCPHDGDLVGVCPDLTLWDLRVFDKNGQADEFTVLAALQFIRHLNAKNSRMSRPFIHGVNVSMSLFHRVESFACGRTPVCDECQRLVNSGSVVVAAAGNAGHTQGAYNDITITDPGNADAVITVGATHRQEPHTYGVSFFSSRGPTGDGRMKPDLIAPGEKITAPIPDEDGMAIDEHDGTSMAAPHVSGAAALLMARNPELVGQPTRIKEILCKTATDLGRERRFQGAGLVDILRALQSV